MSSVEILDIKPKSWEYEEIDFWKSNDYLWVLFTDSEYRQWIWKFDMDCCWITKNKAELLTDEQAVILVDWNFYQININKRVLEKSIIWQTYYDFILNKEANRIIFEDGIWLFIYDLDYNLIFKTKRISIGWIELIKIAWNMLFWNYSDLEYEMLEFEYDFLNNKLIKWYEFFNRI